MVQTIVGVGITYQALRQVVPGQKPIIVNCRGDEDCYMDLLEANDEQYAVDKQTSLPKDPHLLLPL